ncbi:hypothetical protein EYR38_001706 [Pleurotus pulmonarius]|nr:hypothetical protein EYR38_001706 [Pleurotus pulmonarius]
MTRIAFSWTSIPTFEKTTRISALSINRTTPDVALSDFGEWVERCIDNLPHPDLLTELTLEHAVNPTYDDHIEYPADYGAFSSSVARLLARGVIRINVSITITIDFADPEEAITISTADQIASPLTEMPIFEIGHTHLGPQYQNSNLHIASAHPANYSASLARLLAIVPRVRISVSITITAKPIQGLDEVSTSVSVLSKASLGNTIEEQRYGTITTSTDEPFKNSSLMQSAEGT